MRQGFYIKQNLHANIKGVLLCLSTREHVKSIIPVSLT